MARPPVKWAEIATLAAQAFGVEPAAINSPRRDRAACRPRQAAWLASVELVGYSQAEAARRCGDRDHTCVRWGISQARRLIESDPDYASRYTEIAQAVRAKLESADHGDS